ncbi:CDP-alcohol phosphatidyltransferase-domain-containing protein [Pelagophyceae sp. CCMP2097]|nr:CDP-alcohol phosphatidyltransferase-domain-containing protein [Pelagophyceae sp. CCMP2097]|mmetsp:Transcript_22343/g.75581  ORF Transcript_22343/g.75581 Transcript_22343/m.75581 type:complete len:407 (-) Transcript_22343:19-1239(-)
MAVDAPRSEGGGAAPLHAALRFLAGGDVPCRKTVRSYAYVSPPLSLFEGWFLDAFWGELPQRVYPKWLAPNAITVTGLACIILAFCIVVFQSPALDGSAGAKGYAALAVLLFLYQSLDGSDGKQARATKSGSALGEVVDHGVDACTTVLIPLAVLDLAKLGVSSPANWACVVLAAAAFYLSNLTLVHTGRQHFQQVDVQELLVLLQVACAVAAFEHPRLQFSADAARFVVVGAVFGMTSNCATLVKELFKLTADGASNGRGADSAADPGAKSSPDSAGGGRKGLQQQLCGLAAFVAAMALNLALARPDVGRPRTFFVPLAVCATCAFGDLSRRLLLQRVAKLPQLLAWRTPPLLLLASVAFFSGTCTRCCIATFSLVSYAAAAIRTVYAAADALGIRPFSIAIKNA